MAKKCIVEGCGNEESWPQGATGLCAACDQGLRYWAGATPARLVQRQRQLYKLMNRMDLRMGNVRIASKKRRKTA
jgi:hypothetical protein